MAMHQQQSGTLQFDQRLTLTPSMRLALEILQMPYLDLQQFIQQQMEENPMLELEDQNAEQTDIEAPANADDDGDDSSLSEADENLLEALDSEESPQAADVPENDRTGRLIETQPARSASLYDTLTLQLGCLKLDKTIRQLAERLLQQLNEHGYLDTTLDQLAGEWQVPMPMIEEALRAVQSLDPPGIGARNLQDCLLIQLCQLRQADSLAATIVREHFPLFLQHQVKRLASRCDRTLEEIDAACQTIRHLNPRPYRNPDTELSRPWVPELAIRKVDGQFEVELRDDDLPHVMISPSYRQMLRNAQTPGDVKRFLKDRLRQAVWLVRAVEQRHATLLAIARCLIGMQRDFLQHGLPALKPLTQAQVAQAVGRHPSTVGRAIAGKAMETPFGIIALERFFARRVPQEEAREGLSDEKIQSEIRAVIAAEASNRPLSDEAIAQALKSREIAVARRTVAKYRSLLKILPAHLRRRAAAMSSIGRCAEPAAATNGVARAANGHRQPVTPETVEPEPIDAAAGEMKSIERALTNGGMVMTGETPSERALAGADSPAPDLQDPTDFEALPHAHA